MRTCVICPHRQVPQIGEVARAVPKAEAIRLRLKGCGLNSALLWLVRDITHHTIEAASSRQQPRKNGENRTYMRKTPCNCR